MCKSIFSIVIIILSSLSLSGQKVTVSPNISIRNTVSYDIVGRIEDRILFFKEKGPERSVLLYDNNLVYQSERQINLDEKRCFLYEVSNLDSAFAITYGYRYEGEDIIKLDFFDQGAVRRDSVVISRKEKKFKGLNFESIESEDESILALYSITDRDKIKVVTIDLKKRELINDQEYIFTNSNLYDDVYDFKVDNDGFFYMLTQINNFKNAKKNHTGSLFIFSRSQNSVEEIVLPLQDIVCQDLFLSINNQENLIGIAGLYDEKRQDESTGYFWLAGDRSTLSSKSFELIPFANELYFELYGNKHRGRMENFVVSEVIWKQDASALIAFEVAYDVSRRSGNGTGFAINSSTGNNSGLGNGAWSDHYRDDLVLISLDKNVQEEWYQVFYKKQFSQNDNGIFSSFFPFLTPSRLRLIYNDEIKSNSTVSEYILDGKGNYKRSSVLSTEYQDLKLRFADAQQISSTELIVPSQKSFTVNIVKIDFLK